MGVIPLQSITLDIELQPRAAIDRAVLDNYVQLLVDSVTFPPVVVFRTDAALLLVDGFHRWHAHAVLEMDTIAAEVIDGTRRDALLYSLSANALHGLRRKPTDYRRAYRIACSNELVDPTDAEAVTALLRCSGRTGEALTETARTEAKAALDAVIIAASDAGKSVREIATETGVPRATVQDTVRKAQTAETGHPDAPPAPINFENAKRVLTDLNSPRALAWSAALKALREINAQIPVKDLFADPFTGFDHVFGPELDAAFAWISDLHRRFGNGRNRNRRA